MNRVVNRWLAPAMALVAAVSGCGVGDALHDAPHPPARSSYPLKGVIRAIDESKRVLTVRHEEVPGFMPAMAMPLAVTDATDLRILRAGDRITATLRVADGNTRLDAIRVVGHEESSPLQPEALDTPTPMPARPARLSPGDPVPDFAITTQEGATRRLSDWRGKVLILSFIYTRCPLPDFCPLTEEKFRGLASRIAGVPARGDQIQLLTVSFDPEHDTPEVLRRQAALKGARPPVWTYAVASHEELAKAAGALGLMYGPTPTEIIHSLSTAVIGPDGRLVRLELGKGWEPNSVLATAIQAAREARADEAP